MEDQEKEALLKAVGSIEDGKIIVEGGKGKITKITVERITTEVVYLEKD